MFGTPGTQLFLVARKNRKTYAYNTFGSLCVAAENRIK
jgi:hypothetical protein